MGPFDFLRDNGLKVLERVKIADGVSNRLGGLSDQVPAFTVSEVRSLVAMLEAERLGLIEPRADRVELKQETDSGPFEDATTPEPSDAAKAQSRTRMDMEKRTIGQIAYDAWECGDPIGWENLIPSSRKCWEASAAAVARRVMEVKGYPR